MKVHNYFLKQYLAQNINQYTILPKDLIKYNSSDKVIVPEESLNDLANNSKENIYVLRLTNPKNSQQVYVSIGDFSAPHNNIFLPDWVMQSLTIKNNDMIHVDAVSVPPVSEVKIKIPKDIDQKDDIKVVIEFLLKNHTILYIGKTISTRVFEKSFLFDIVDLKPGKVGTIANLDVKLEIV